MTVFLSTKYVPAVVWRAVSFQIIMGGCYSLLPFLWENAIKELKFREVGSFVRAI